MIEGITIGKPEINETNKKEHNGTIYKLIRAKVGGKGKPDRPLVHPIKKRDRMNNTSIKNRNCTCSKQKKRQWNIITITPIHLQVQAKRTKL